MSFLNEYALQSKRCDWIVVSLIKKANKSKHSSNNELRGFLYWSISYHHAISMYVCNYSLFL